MGNIILYRKILAITIISFGVLGCSAHAATLDFTQNPYIGDEGSVAGTTYKITAEGGTLSWGQNRESNSCFGLICAKDGLGIGDDEITMGNENIIIDFGALVRITNLAFLDLFSTPGGANRERAMVDYNGGTVFFDAVVTETPGITSGFSSIGNLNLITNKLVFYAGGTNDNLGADDFALAAIGVSAVPLPPALLMFGAALGGLGFLRRKRKKT